MVFASMLPWRFFATSFSEAGNSLIANANMISVEDMKQGEDTRIVIAPHWQDANIRYLEIIGQTTKRIGKSLKKKHTEVH